MTRATIASVAVAHPAERVSQTDVLRLMELGRLARLKARAIARASCIDERRVVLPPDDISRLVSVEERNSEYQRFAPALAAEAAASALERSDRAAVGGLVTSSCTGYTIPSLATHLVEGLELSQAVARLPINEAGCAGGIIALARAADLVGAAGGQTALAVAVELCSLSFHARGDEGVLTSNLIFADGAGAALVEQGPGRGLEVVDAASLLVPGTRHLLGFDLTSEGFVPVLDRRLVDVLPRATLQAVESMLRRQGLTCGEIGAWLLHPGGARILDRLERGLSLSRSQTRWSWESLREFGNTSSAAIFDVLHRYLEEDRPPEWAVAAAFGPGVSIELLLVRRTCD